MSHVYKGEPKAKGSAYLFAPLESIYFNVYSGNQWSLKPAKQNLHRFGMLYFERGVQMNFNPQTETFEQLG